MPATAVGPSGSGCRVRLGDAFELEAAAGDVAMRGPGTVTIRPERVLLQPAGATGPNRVPAMVMRSVYLGAAQQVHVQLAAGPALTMLASHQGDEAPPEHPAGTSVTCYLPAAALRVLRPSAVAPSAPEVADDEEG